MSKEMDNCVVFI